MSDFNRKWLFALLSLLMALPGWGQIHLYVSARGSDGYEGTLNRPLKTLSHALSIAGQHPGEAVFVELRAGTYYLDSTVILDEGACHFASLTIRPFHQEKVSISAGQPLKLNWRPYRNGIYQATVPRNSSFERLYVDGRLQVLARYPNDNAQVRIFHGYAKDAIAPDRVKTWKEPEGAYIHDLQINEWGSVHYRVTGVDKDGQLTLTGGWQNNRDSAMHPQYRFVENVFEELDTAAEWFLDRKKNILYFYPPAGLELHKARVEVAHLENSLVLRGTRQRPLRNVKIEHLNFLHNERSFMDTRASLLRSDWRIYRGGAVLLEGTEGCRVSACRFEYIGGNAVFFSNYNQYDTIRQCLIDHIGGNGIVFAGSPRAVRSPLFSYSGRIPFSRLDKTPGPAGNDYPQDCLAQDNLIHDIGEIEKQVAGVDIDMAAAITVCHNSIYNTPRAGINIGSGCWGGNVLAYNDVFNTVLETGDNGAFNSWGRDRFWDADRKYMDSLVAVHPELILLDVQQPNSIHDNRFQCDHGWDIDLDDGSSNYHIFNNVCLSGGLKLREGFDRIVENNVLVNNSFHPHVWFKNSKDVFRHNIVMKRYFPIGIHYWGKLIDSNLFPGLSELTISEEAGTDRHSLFGDPLFVDPSAGNYAVKKNSPALKTGFVNFPMTRFGVQDPVLKQMALHPAFPALQYDRKAGEEKEGDAATGETAATAFLGGKIRSVHGLGDRSAFGLPDENGVIVVSAGSHSLLSGSGLQAGDVILSADKVVVKDVRQLLDKIQASAWKPEVPIEVMRNQQRIPIWLLLR